MPAVYVWFSLIAILSLVRLAPLYILALSAGLELLDYRTDFSDALTAAVLLGGVFNGHTFGRLTLQGFRLLLRKYRKLVREFADLFCRRLWRPRNVKCVTFCVSLPSRPNLPLR
jgi:hypothetical protein